MIKDEIQGVIEKVKYPPEGIPFVHALNLSLGDNPIYSFETPVLSRHRVLFCDGISLVRSNQVIAEIYHDEQRVSIEAGALLNIGEINEFKSWAYRNTSLVLKAKAAVSDYQLFLLLWIIKPDVAEKLFLSIPLTPSEERIKIEKKVDDPVEKGLLPIPLSYRLEREYLGKVKTHSYILPTVSAGTTTRVDILRPGLGEFLVLEGISAERPPSLGYNTQIYISRDEDKRFIKLPTFAMDLSYEVPSFIVALDELALEVYTATALTNYRVRFKIGYYRLTNLLRMRWGLLPPEEKPELYRSVVAGVLP